MIEVRYNAGYWEMHSGDTVIRISASHSPTEAAYRMTGRRYEVAGEHSGHLVLTPRKR